MDLLLDALLQMEDHLRSGGTVMIPLVILSLVMWLLIIDRSLYFRQLHRRNMTPGMAWEHILKNRSPDPALYGGTVSTLVTEFVERRTGDREVDRFILDETVLRVNRTLDDYLWTIGALAGIAPLLGLLGTVIGMIVTFDVIAVFGTGNTNAMAGGISEALITTQTGLLVAIPGLYMKSFLDRRAHKLKQRNAAVGYYLRRRL